MAFHLFQKLPSAIGRRHQIVLFVFNILFGFVCFQGDLGNGTEVRSSIADDVIILMSGIRTRGLASRSRCSEIWLGQFRYSFILEDV